MIKTNYEVKRIISERWSISGHVEYLIKWEGTPASKQSWEPEMNTQNFEMKLQEFKERKAKYNAIATKEQIFEIITKVDTVIFRNFFNLNADKWLLRFDEHRHKDAGYCDYPRNDNELIELGINRANIRRSYPNEIQKNVRSTIVHKLLHLAAIMIDLKDCVHPSQQGRKKCPKKSTTISHRGKVFRTWKSKIYRGLQTNPETKEWKITTKDLGCDQYK